VEQRPVGQVGERVVQGQMPDLLLGRLALRDVHGGTDRADDAPVRIAYG
jgi:hypothetical protein